MNDPDRPTVHRGRLLGRLARRCDRRVTLVIAGAGFGKTTLVRQMLDDPAPIASMTDVLVALRSPAPSADGLVQLLARAITTAAPVGVDVDVLVDLIWARSPEHVVIIVDDVHLLDAAGGALLRQLHDRLPQNGHLVLVGRRQPFELPQRMLLDGSADVLDEGDLAFDDDELLAFERLRGEHPSSVLDAAPTRWPALLELEWASGRSGVVRYLVEELIEGLEPQLRSLLRAVALHSPVDDSIVEAVASALDDNSGVASGWVRPTLAGIRAALPMTTWVDGESSVVMHDLVRQALVAGLNDADRRRAQGRIASVLTDRGDFASAVSMYAEIGDLAAIDAIARTLVDDIYMRDATDSNRQLLDLLRRSLGENMTLDALDGVLTLLDHPERARPLLEQVAAGSLQAGDGSLETLCVFRLADDAYCASDRVALERHVARLHQLARNGSASALRIGFAADIWPLSLSGRHADVVELVDGVLLDPDGTLDDEMRDYARYSWVIHRAYAGHIVDALEAAEVLRRFPDGLYANRVAGFELVQRWQLGQLSAAQRADAVLLVDRIEAMGQVALFIEGAATTALFHASAGDVTTAQWLLERAERELPRLPTTAWPVHTVAQCRAVLQVMAGDEAAAAATLRVSLPEQGVAGLPRFVYGASAALSYVLLPETRAVWDTEPCGPDHLIRRQVAHALVAVREQHDLSLAASLPWDDLQRLRTWAYEPHLAELATAAVEAGTTRAGVVFDDLRHDPRRHLAALADGGEGPIAARAATVLRTVPQRPSAPLRATLLGPMTLDLAGVPVNDDVWTRRQRVRDLFGLLVDHRSVDRASLAQTLWPEKTSDAAAGNLRYTLNQLLGVIEPQRETAGPSWHVRSIGQQLTLVTGDLLVLDVDEFQSMLAGARLEDRSAAPGRALDRYRSAIDLYGGPYLVDTSDTGWGYLERLRLQGELVDAVSRSVDLLVAANELEEAERLAAKAVGVEPLNERATGSLAQVLLQRGRIGAAREIVLQLLKELVSVGLQPDPRTLDLVARLGLE